MTVTDNHKNIVVLEFLAVLYDFITKIVNCNQKM